jgi:hypothetical protein
VPYGKCPSSVLTVLLTPPLTLAALPLAVLTKPPLTLLNSPLAVLPSPLFDLRGCSSPK